ncbi:MAG: helix-turn-helix domain-containing protein [Treponema sp.]|nr:helix-turn-helix domain-containing protein [Treponema sp.]
MTDLRQLLGSNIKIYRNTCGISQSKLAERVNTATNYIAAIEAGRRFPSVEILEKIASALEIDAPELFAMKNVQYFIKKKELETEIWQNIGQNLSSYITKNLADLKKQQVKEKPNRQCRFKDK